jgi:hypothetical protein
MLLLFLCALLLASQAGRVWGEQKKEEERKRRKKERKRKREGKEREIIGEKKNGLSNFLEIMTDKIYLLYYYLSNKNRRC